MDSLDFLSVAQMTKEQAREMVEQIRWPDGAICPHCESADAYKLTPRPDSKRPVRPGVYKCKSCRKQFTVTVGTIFEGSRIPMNKWLVAIYLMCASKKGISAHQLHRQLKITYKSAWFMCHRIRYAMTQEPLSGMLTGTVEADETYIGGKKRGGKRGRGSENKTPVATLVERGGRVRAKKVARVDGKTLKDNIRKNVDPTAHIMTDEFLSYRGIGKEFASHQTVLHGKGEYVRGDVYTNSAESFFALLKRGVIGTFHHVSEQHLNRYLDEFSFRWDMRNSDDGDRAIKAVIGSKGKRLYYREPIQN